MKTIIRALCLVLVAWLPAAQAANLTGTASIVYQNAHYVFRNLNNATGYVRLNNGFTILAGQSAALDTFITVSGAIDLRTTGSLDLRSDLYLASNITFSTGGYINGRSNTIHLGDDVTLPTDSVFQFVSNTVIDGNNQNALIFAPHAQLLLESRVSLTLKNMTIKTTRNSPNIPIIRCFDQKGHVTLDNVTLELADDFPFRKGRIFFRNDVRFTGTSCFIYQSVMQSYVSSRSLLTFDSGTTLYYFPSSTDKDLIQLADKSSVLLLKGSGTTLQTTNTGMRLTKGRFWLDNKVTIDTIASTAFNTITQVTTQNYGATGTPNGSAWTPNARYLGIAGIGSDSGNEIQIFSFNGATLSLVASVDWGSGGATYNIKWRPDGRTFAVTGNQAASGLKLYRFDGTTITLLYNVSLTTAGQFVFGLDWSNDGQYLALGIPTPTSGNEIQIYKFSGISPPTLVTGVSISAAATNGPDGISWHPSDRFLAVGAGNSVTDGNEVRVYSFNGTALTLVTSVDYGTEVNYVEFSPDGRFIAVGGTVPTSGNELQIYAFNGTSLQLIASADIAGASSVIQELRWDPTGQFLAVGATAVTGNTGLRIYKFDGSTLTLLSSIVFSTSGFGAYSFSWSADGKYLAVGGAIPGSGHNEIEVYSISYTTETAVQALSNGLVLGNSVAGATFDLDTTIFGGSRVELFGRLLYDPFS
ncbi:WD40 repeat domain-containing protein [Candidatus Babeliales bacterium]|nr:WD40 repeat domain-containing protein [Candidatus Babeliales bacterium]